ncbi:Uncharacterised protein [uncultured archaeon]|nr:Uncharacterised protein [uncultured archaeon]
MWTVIIVVLAVLLLAIWMFGEAKRSSHKLVSIFIIVLILFLVLSMVFVFSGKQVDYKTVPGLFSAGKIYFSWLGGAFGNVKAITSNAINMNWKGNESTVLNSTKK